jgi:hypothetical protein
VLLKISMKNRRKAKSMAEASLLLTPWPPRHTKVLASISSRECALKLPREHMPQNDSKSSSQPYKMTTHVTEVTKQGSRGNNKDAKITDTLMSP